MSATTTPPAAATTPPTVAAATLVYHIEKYVGSSKEGNAVWPNGAFGERCVSLADAQKKLDQLVADAKNANTFALISHEATLGPNGHVTGVVNGSAKVVDKKTAAGKTTAAAATAST